MYEYYCCRLEYFVSDTQKLVCIPRYNPGHGTNAISRCVLVLVFSYLRQAPLIQSGFFEIVLL